MTNNSECVFCSISLNMIAVIWDLYISCMACCLQFLQIACPWSFLGWTIKRSLIWMLQELMFAEKKNMLGSKQEDNLKLFIFVYLSYCNFLNLINVYFNRGVPQASDCLRSLLPHHRLIKSGISPFQVSFCYLLQMWQFVICLWKIDYHQTLKAAAIIDNPTF